jgi:hypothetical protein
MKQFTDCKLQELMDCCEKFASKLYIAANEGNGVLSNLTCKEVYHLDNFINLFDEWLDTDYISDEEIIQLYKKCNVEYIPVKIRNICENLKTS